MLLQNPDLAAGVINGSRGTVVSHIEEADTIPVHFDGSPDNSPPTLVTRRHGVELPLSRGRHMFMHQFLLKPSWAVDVSHCQRYFRLRFRPHCLICGPIASAIVRCPATLREMIRRGVAPRSCRFLILLKHRLTKQRRVSNCPCSDTLTKTQKTIKLILFRMPDCVNLIPRIQMTAAFFGIDLKRPENTQGLSRASINMITVCLLITVEFDPISSFQRLEQSSYI